MKKFQKIPLSSFMSPLKNGTLVFSIYLKSWKKNYTKTGFSKCNWNIIFPTSKNNKKYIFA